MDNVTNYATVIETARMSGDRADFLFLSALVDTVNGGAATVKATGRTLQNEYNWTSKTWSNRVSEIRSLVKGSKSAGFGTDVMAYLADIADDCDTWSWKVQTVANKYGLRTATPSKGKGEATAEGENVTDGETVDASATPLIDVMLSNINNLSADELTILAMAIGARQDALANAAQTVAA